MLSEGAPVCCWEMRESMREGTPCLLSRIAGITLQTTSYKKYFHLSVGMAQYHYTVYKFQGELRRFYHNLDN